jgi:lipopolysaccharide/colanic/teichoic acid biosynthesis glycosyltransferase
MYSSLFCSLKIERKTLGLSVLVKTIKMKFIVDKLVSGLGLLLLSPVLAVLSISIFVFIGRPVFFKQQRPGLNGKPFMLYKFRTMSTKTDQFGVLLPDSERLTTFGKLLRSTSLDELPTLFCVLKGDMSLIGPRPLLMQYLPLYSQEQARRNLVRPGVTGWAQINGRNTLSWQQKFELDVWYVDNQSWKLDIQILLKTFRKVIQREGISAEDHVTIEPFAGNVSTECLNGNNHR